MLTFLLTETECERTFVEERTVHSGRPRMDPNTRFACLKVKTDGLPFHELHEDGMPVNMFWRCCQDAYAKRFGTKYVRDVKPRKDRGNHRKTLSAGWQKHGRTFQKKTATRAAQSTGGVSPCLHRCHRESVWLRTHYSKQVESDSQAGRKQGISIADGKHGAAVP